MIEWDTDRVVAMIEVTVDGVVVSTRSVRGRYT